MLAAAAVLLSFAATAQIQSLFPDTIDKSFNWADGAYFNYEANGTGIDLDFASKLYNGKFIDKPLKDRVSNRITAENRMGADLSYGIYHIWKPDSFFNSRSDVSMFINMKNNEHYDMRFSRDLFNLAFYGNRPFAGDTAVLGGFSANLLRYQELQFGVLWSGLDSLARVGIALSVLNAEQMFSVNASRADLFTAEDGQYIDFNTTLAAYRSDTANKSYAAHNGFGFSADFFFEAPYKGKRKAKIMISASDVGLLFWNDNSYWYAADSAYHYEGKEVENIFGAGDSTLGDISPQKLFNSVTTRRQQSYAASIPATIHLRHTIYFKRFELAKGFKYMFNANYKGFWYAQATFNLPGALNAGVIGGFGGYGKFSFGAHVSKTVSRKLFIAAGADHLEGFIAPKKFAGHGIYLAMRYKFR